MTLVSGQGTGEAALLPASDCSIAQCCHGHLAYPYLVALYVGEILL